MSDGFYSTDWDNQDQSQNQYANQSYDPSAAYNQSYDQSAYNPAQYSGQSYQPGSFLLFFYFQNIQTIFSAKTAKNSKYIKL